MIEISFDFENINLISAYFSNTKTFDFCCSDPAPATSKSRQQTENDNMSEIRQLIPVIKFDIASVQSPLIVSQIRLSDTMLGSSENNSV